MGQLAATTPYSPPPMAVVGRPASADAVVGAAGFVGDASRADGSGAGRAMDPMLVQTMVAAAVRDMLAHPDPGAADAPSSDGADADAGDAAPAVFGAAVIAAHDERIALLRDRLTGLCAADSGSPLLAGLRERLRRAEAARQVAVARSGGDRRADAPPPLRDDTMGCASARPRLATLHAGGQRRQGTPARPVPAETSRDARTYAASPIRALHVVRVSRPPSVRPAIRLVSVAPHGRIAWAHRTPRVRMAAATFHHHHAGHGVADRQLAARLRHARRSLADARRALGERRPVPMLRSFPVLAGLWRWDGSDRWQLRPATRVTG